jgi:hypothetical protein
MKVRLGGFMEAKVAILGRIKDGDGYRLITLEKRRGSFVKPKDEVLAYYLRYTDAITGKRCVKPVTGDFDAIVVQALNLANQQNAIRNNQASTTAEQFPVPTERLTVAEAVEIYLAHLQDRLIA